MSFENTKNNIANLENGEPISDEVMFNLLGIVMKDIQQTNAKLEVPKMGPDEKRGFAMAVRNVLKKTLRALQDNQDCFQQLSARSQEECQELMAKIKERERELDNYAQIELEREKLKKQVEELEAQNRAFLKVTEECKTLQARVAELSDNTLEDKEAELNRLKADLQTRKEKAGKIQAEIDDINEAIAKTQGDSQAKTTEKERLDNQLKTLNQELEMLKKAINSGNEEYAKVEQVISEIKTANNALLEKQSEYAELFVALNSALSDPFIKEALFKLDDSAEVLSISDSPDLKQIGMRINSAADLESWISKIQSRIELLINVYQTELQKITEWSEVSLYLTAMDDRSEEPDEQ